MDSKRPRPSFLARYGWALAFVGGVVGAMFGQLLTPTNLEPAIADGNEDTAAVKIGFVDVKTVFETYEKTQDREAEINDRFRAQIEELKARAGRLAQEIDALGLMPSDSPVRREKERELALAEFKIKFDEEWLKEVVKEELKSSTESIYAEVIRTLGPFAEARGYTAVFKIDVESIQSFDRNELKFKIHTKTVLFSRGMDDLTQPFIEFLNDEYRD